MKNAQLLVLSAGAMTLAVFLGHAQTSSAPQPKLEKAPPMPDVSVSVQSLDRQEVVKYGFGNIRWLMSSQLDKDAAQTFGVVEIAAGQKNMLHAHPNCEELLYVLSGTCDHIVGKKKFSLKPGDLIRVPAGVPHQAIVTGKAPLRAVISYSSGDRQVVNYAPAAE